MSNTSIVPLTNSIRQPIDSLVRSRNAQSGRDPNSRGVYSSFPFTSPKYMKHRGNRNHEFEDTMARMFIQVSPKDYTTFLASLDDDETRRIAKTLTGDGDKQGGVGYIDFFLQNANHTLTEKMQVVETLSDNYVAFFFGHTAPIWSYQGTLMNTYQDDWTMRMYRIFRDLARGTQLAKRGLLLHMRYDSLVIAGAMVNFNWSLRSGQEMACPFQFDILIKSVSVLYGGYAPPTVLQSENRFLPEGVNLTAALSEGSPMQTYVGSPSTGLGPDGVSAPLQSRERDEWELLSESTQDTGEHSPTGIYFQPPVTEDKSDFSDYTGQSTLEQ